MKKMIFVALGACLLSGNLFSYKDEDLKKALNLNDLNQKMKIPSKEEKELEKSDLCCANLSAKSLRNASFNDSNFFGANLADSNFSKTNLTRTNFSSANLIRANFSDAYLKDTNFIGANLEGANFKNADSMSQNQKEYAKSQGAINVPN